MKKTPIAAISVAILLWPFSALATSSCDFVLQWDRDTLTRCIDELHKEIDMNKVQIQTLQSENMLIFRELCMVATEQARSNPSEMLKLVIEDACSSLKKPTVPKPTVPKKRP
jgi:acetolactate synthase small subunit